MKQLLCLCLLTFSCHSMADWVVYSTRSNGDVFYYDNARVAKTGSQIKVWTRAKYKTSIMAASSYQSLLKLDCTDYSETVLQSTFYTDSNWTKPAMATNTNAKPAQPVTTDSITAQLLEILCRF